MEQYTAQLEKQGLVISDLSNLMMTDLKDMGVKNLSHRNLIMAAASYCSVAMPK